MKPLESTLLDYLAQVPDTHCRRGQRYAWSFPLMIVASALLAGQLTVLEMALWSHQHAAELLTEWQRPQPRLPSPATLRRLL